MKWKRILLKIRMSLHHFVMRSYWCLTEYICKGSQSLFAMQGWKRWERRSEGIWDKAYHKA